MIIVANAGDRRLFESDLVNMHRQRKTVFVEEARWRIAVIGDMEVGKYDRQDTLHLFAEATGLNRTDEPCSPGRSGLATRVSMPETGNGAPGLLPMGP